ncbi:DUF3800 domain-containing protein [Pseudoxanthomonas helianthi]|uniref:DUF3800 domain-containing protein n=1 Tax=Pseudoxanthomonas helianthi TaxID=1453541 RepID=A0A940X364_9GAMM|nr:DUF3800 domain-containing protein [Pseudoxanthomonas helianthi]MBP3984277.1 DUF3800 domain-containing protein [Pseudoxanthomonas helianthi]
MERLHVFIDEFGDANLDVAKNGVSSTYIVAAVCVRERVLDSAKASAEDIRKKHFQSGEMKSSLIGSNDERRLKLLRDISKLDTFVFGFCARKEDVDKNSGLMFKKSFIKFFASALYKRIDRCAADIHVLIDEHGSESFRNELKSYLGSKFKGDFFSDTRFDFGDSKDHVLLQVADIYAGSLARIYDEKKASPRSGELKSVLGKRISVTLWPSGRSDGNLPVSEFSNEDDESVRRYCVMRAEEYIDRVAGNIHDKDEVARVVFLDALLAHHSVSDPGEFLSTYTLKREIAAQLGETVSDHRFRSIVVAKLRDADVIISSCSKGYRIPSCVADVIEFATFANSIIPPMVSRVARARKGIREATLGRIDMLENSSFCQLNSMAGCID